MLMNGVQSYRKTNVITADPKRLVILCYEGAIDNLKMARERYRQKDYEGKCKSVKKALDIIDEMLCSLDFEKGGAIARNLKSIYNYMTRRIIQADVNKDVTGFDEVIGLLNELKSAWEAITYGRNIQIDSARTGRGRELKQASGSISI